MRLLFVDDNPDDVLLAALVLRRDGLTFEEHAVSTLEELARALDDGPWDAIISDYNLVGFSGRDTLRLVRRRDANVPFLLLSGTIGEERAAEAIREGASDYVAKDSPVRLAAALRREVEAARARRALLDAEQRYRQTIDHAPIGIVNADAHGRFLSVNERFCTIVGYTKEELLRLDIRAISHPDDLAMSLERYATIVSGEAHSIEYDRRYLHKAGVVVWAHVTWSAIRERDGSFVYAIGLVEDITESRQTREQLLLQSLLLDSVEQGVVATDRKGIVTYWSRYAGVMSGWTAAEAVGRSAFEVAYDDTDGRAAQITERLQQGESWSGEMRLRRKDGSDYPSYVIQSPLFDLNGELTGVVSVSQDLTEHKLAEAELLEHKLQLSEAQEIARVGSWTLEFATGVRKFSDALCSIFSVDRSLPLTMDDFHARVHPDDRAAVLALHEQVQTCQEACSAEFRILTPEGEKLVMMRLCIIGDEQGTPRKALGVVQDVTEVRRAEEELRRRALLQAAVANLGSIALSGASVGFLLEQAAVSLRTVLAADVSEVLQQERDRFVLVAGAGWDEHEIGLEKAAVDSQAAFTIQSAQPVFTFDMRRETRFKPADLLLRKGVISGLTVAISSGDGTPWGILGVHACTTRHFTPYEVDFLRSVATVLGQAIDRAAADAELRARARQQSAIASLGRLALTALDTNVLDRACELLRKGCGADFAFMNELTERGTLRLRAGTFWSMALPHEIPVAANAQAGYTILTNEAVLVADYRTEKRFDTYAATVPYGILSGVMVPVASARRTFGILSAQSRVANHFRAEDVDFLQSLANMLAEAMERENARAAVEESEHRYRRIFEGAREIIFTLDAAGHFISLNPAFEAVTGWKAEEWIGKSFAGLFDTPEAERLNGVLHNMLHNCSTFDEELVLNGRDRKVQIAVTSFPKAAGDGTVTEIYGFARDITEARRATAEREQVTRSLELLLQSTVEGIYTLDLEGRCTMVNKAAATFLGLKPDEIIGMRVHDLLHPVHADGNPLPIEECMIHDVLRGGEPRTVTNEVFRRKDGTLIPVAYSAAPIVDRGERVGAVITFTDLTERRKLEIKLEQANRLTSLGRLAATVAHEFNNVLMGIAPFVEVVRRSPSPQKVSSSLDHIAASVKRGRRITQDILRFTQPAEPVRAVVEANSWLQSLAVEARSLLTPNYVLVVDAEPLVMDADSSQLHQIFTNLILNARDAMPNGGTIRIGAKRESNDVRFPFGPLEEPARYAHLTVSDSGCGMDEDTLRHAFEPLFTTKKNGTGLGLAVTHQVVQRHGGEIFCESTEGRGTTFHIFLPLTHDARPPVPAPLPAHEAERRVARRILLVEDDVAVAAGLMTLLEFEGFDVTLADSGQKAIRAVRAELPDAVVLDVGLPDMDGQSVYAAIAAEYPTLPVVFSTGHAERGRLEELLVRPNVQYLLKPYEADALMDALTRVMSA